MRLFLLLSLIAVNSYALCMEKSPRTFEDIFPRELRAIIFNDYKKLGAKIVPVWNEQKQDLTIMTFAPDEKKEIAIINDADSLSAVGDSLTNEIKSGAFLTEQQFERIKNVHFQVWKNKENNKLLEVTALDDKKNQLAGFLKEKCNATVQSSRRLEKTRGLYLIEFNLYFAKHENDKTSFIPSENTKQLAVYDSLAKKRIYIGCPDPSWKNFDSVKSVSVERVLATELFRNTLQDIDQKK